MAAHADPTLYLYTSLTAGSSHIITATSRLETILKANKIPFKAVDCATDEKARMLWGRRSKGRKLPGLVKFAQIIGDLEQIEEWNEYGELKDQISSINDDLGALPSAAASLAPEPPVASSTSTPQRSGPPSRASSETRHISISEPSDKDREKDTSDGAARKLADTPLNIAIRQLGAEAAAKAGQKKAAAAEAARAKAASVPTKEPSTSEQTPSPAVTKLSTDAAVDNPSTAAETTAGKTPTQLVAEGANPSSLDKITTSVPDMGPDQSGITSPPISGGSPSTEAQVLEHQRSSSITHQKSRLSESTPVEAVSKEETPPTSPSAVPVARRQHRGSDIGEATKEEIRELEKKLSIPEEDSEDEEEASKVVEEEEDEKDEDEDEGDDDEDEDEDEDEEDEDEDEDGEKDDSTKDDAKEDVPTSKVQGEESTDKVEKEATKAAEPVESNPKDPKAAGISVGD